MDCHPLSRVDAAKVRCGAVVTENKPSATALLYAEKSYAIQSGEHLVPRAKNGKITIRSVREIRIIDSPLQRSHHVAEPLFGVSAAKAIHKSGEPRKHGLVLL